MIVQERLETKRAEFPKSIRVFWSSFLDADISKRIAHSTTAVCMERGVQRGRVLQCAGQRPFVSIGAHDMRRGSPAIAHHAWCSDLADGTQFAQQYSPAAVHMSVQ